MVRLFNRGLLPFGIWEQLLEAEKMMDEEVHQNRLTSSNNYSYRDHSQP